MKNSALNVKYLCTQWGSEEHTASNFLQLAINDGYDGVEINMPQNEAYINDFERALYNVRATIDENFVFVLQLVPDAACETAEAYYERIAQRLLQLESLKPDFINSHTGKDHFTFEQNCKAIEQIAAFSERTGIPVYHEIHRGRFTFHSATTLSYLEKYPDLKLTGDFSHWCTVSESLLQDQRSIMEQVIPHIAHLHARIGFEQGPQVNDPSAPEWQEHCRTFTRWWQQVADHHKHAGTGQMTITPEYGPAPYMPRLPFSRIPLSNQWINNIDMMEFLKTNLIL